MERHVSDDLVEAFCPVDECSFTPQSHSPSPSSLSSLDRSELLSLWHEVMGRPAPKRLSRKFMVLAIEHERRCSIDGWLSARELRILQAYLNTDDKSVFRQEQFKCGDRLVREWNGKVYEVEVLENGFLFKGKKYRSLSGIAKLITCTNWSGPRFFGLRSVS